MAKKPVQLDERGYRKYGMIDNLAYAAGDFGCNMSFALKSYLTLFWTQFMGIDSVLMSGLLILVNIWDAINDPVIGSMVDADKHQYKRNKFLQYIWVGSIGLLVAGALCYVPWTSAPYVVKCILFVAGYILWDAFYTIANVPYGSMLSLISEDAGDRASLSTFRSVGSMAGNILCMILVPMIIYDANQNIKGEVMFFMALVMGAIGFVCFQFMIKNTVIRVDTSVRCNDEETPKFNVVKACVNFFKNRAAVGATLAPVGMFIGMYGAQTSSQIMWQAYFKNSQISGLMSMISYLPMFLFMPFIRKIVSKWGKKEAVTVASTIMLIGYGLMVILPMTPDSKGIAMYVACSLIAGIGNGIYQCVSWSLMADAMDYGEWKLGVREEGTTYALHSFFRKLAQGIGPSIGLLVAVALGYDESLKAAQTAQTALNMRYQTAVFYAISGVLMFVGLVLIYNLDKKTLDKMNTELADRRAGNK